MELTSHFKDKRHPFLTISRDALVPLLWSVNKSPDEFSFWGVIDAVKGGFRLRSATLSKHESCLSYNDPDMEWYADWVTDKVADEGLMPWQLACWIHTHPSGINTPSCVDEKTFASNFGDQRLAFMVIMTKAGSVYAKMSAVVEPMDGTEIKTYTSTPLRVEFEEGPPATEEEITALNAAYPSLVTPYIHQVVIGEIAPSNRESLFHMDDDELAMWGDAIGSKDIELKKVGQVKRRASRTIKDRFSVLDQKTLVDYLIEGATVEYDDTVTFERFLTDYPTIAENLCADGQDAPIWLVTRLYIQITSAMRDEKIIDEVRNAVYLS